MNRAQLKTVLYVDDEPDLREIVEMALGLASGLTVHTCDGGERALALLPQLQPDLVLIDVMMPGMDGPTTLGHMRENPAFAHIPVMFMTAKAMPQEVARFHKLGAAAVLAKPFDPLKLSAQVLENWERLPE